VVGAWPGLPFAWQLATWHGMVDGPVKADTCHRLRRHTCMQDSKRQSRHVIIVNVVSSVARRKRSEGDTNLIDLQNPYYPHGPLYSSSIRPSQQDSLLYTQFFRTHPSSISSSIHSIHCGTHLSLYLNISMCNLVLKNLLRRI
jgi:hypothetical protein